MASIRGLIALLSYAIALCGIVPLFPWLAAAPRLALVAGMIAGIWQDRYGVWPLKNRWLNAAIVPVFLFYAIQFSRANPIQPVVSVLAVMLAVRLGGEKSGRHYLQIQALALFCLAASSLFDLSPLFLVYLSAMLLLVAVTLVLLTFHALDSRMTLSRGEMRKVILAGLLMPLASLPLLVFFFPLLPRTQLPLWNLLPLPAASVSGFSDKVEPGRAETVAAARTLAFRAEMPALPQKELYWRGTVFNRVVGNRWVRDATPPPERIAYRGGRIVQTIYPEPGPSRALIALDAPAAIALPQAKRSPDGVYELPRITPKRLGYTAESVTSGILPVTVVLDRPFYLTLPDGLSPAIRGLADDIRRNSDSEAGRIDLLERYFRNNNYRYSLTGLPTGPKALEQFLFTKKQGQCEFFASAFALVLRAAEVPARLVAGYLGGEYNEMGGYYLVSEDMAHVWVEAYVNGKGWMRIDPSGFATNAGAVWGASRQRGVMDELRMALDSLDHTWNRTVISYDFESQVEAARSAGRRLQGFQAGKVLRALIPIVIVLTGSIGAVFMFSRRKRLFPAPEERLLRSFYRRVVRDCGVQPHRGQQGLFELAEVCGNAKIRDFVNIYAGAVYRDRKLTAEEFKQLQRMLKEGF